MKADRIVRLCGRYSMNDNQVRLVLFSTLHRLVHLQGTIDTHVQGDIADIRYTSYEGLRCSANKFICYH